MFPSRAIDSPGYRTVYIGEGHIRTCIVLREYRDYIAVEVATQERRQFAAMTAWVDITAPKQFSGALCRD